MYYVDKEGAQAIRNLTLPANNWYSAGVDVWGALKLQEQNGKGHFLFILSEMCLEYDWLHWSSMQKPENKPKNRTFSKRDIAEKFNETRKLQSLSDRYHNFWG